MDAHDNKSLNCDNRVKTMQLFWRFSLSPKERDGSLLDTSNYNFNIINAWESIGLNTIQRVKRHKL